MFNKGKYKVQHVSQGNPKHKYRLGREGIESTPEKKDLGGCLRMKKLTPPVIMSLQLRKPTIINQIINQKIIINQ